MNEVDRQRLLQFMYEKKQREQYVRHLANLHESTGIAREAGEGTVIEGVVVRKPQPRLT